MRTSTARPSAQRHRLGELLACLGRAVQMDPPGRYCRSATAETHRGPAFPCRLILARALLAGIRWEAGPVALDAMEARLLETGLAWCPLLDVPACIAAVEAYQRAPVVRSPAPDMAVRVTWGLERPLDDVSPMER